MGYLRLLEKCPETGLIRDVVFLRLKMRFLRLLHVGNRYLLEDGSDSPKGEVSRYSRV